MAINFYSFKSRLFLIQITSEHLLHNINKTSKAKNLLLREINEQASLSCFVHPSQLALGSTDLHINYTHFQKTTKQ